MNQPVTFAIETPKLSGAKLGSATRIDRPVQLTLAPVRLPDGTEPVADSRVAVFVYRLSERGEQIWNELAAAWQTCPADDELGTLIAGSSLNYAQAGQSWTSVLNAAPQLDATGAPRYEPALATIPKYFARVLVTVTHDGTNYRGLSGPSEPLGFVRVATIVLPAARLEPAGLNAAIEQPIEIFLPPLLLPDGAQITPDKVLKFGVFVYRGAEIWNENQQCWQTAPADDQGLADWSPITLDYKAGQALPWQATLVAMGLIDKNKAKRFVPGGFAYQLRVFALIRNAGVVYLGLGAASEDILFVETMGQELFKIEFDSANGAKDCSEAKIRLLDAARNPVGYVLLNAVNRQVKVTSCDSAGTVRASLLLTSTGAIEVTGTRLIVHGNLEAEHIRYLPIGGGSKRDL